MGVGLTGLCAHVEDRKEIRTQLTNWQLIVPCHLGQVFLR